MIRRRLYGADARGCFRKCLVRLNSSTSPVSAAAAGPSLGVGPVVAPSKPSPFSNAPVSIPPSVTFAAGPGFDTYAFVAELEQAGLSREQSVAIMKQVTLAVKDGVRLESELLATKSDLLKVQSDLGEKFFNSSMKLDFALRHNKEIMVKDLQSLRADLMAADQTDSISITKDLAEMERASLRRREQDEQRFAAIQTEISAVERRILQFGIGTLITLATLGLGVARLLQ